MIEMNLTSSFAIVLVSLLFKPEVTSGSLIFRIPEGFQFGVSEPPFFVIPNF